MKKQDFKAATADGQLPVFIDNRGNHCIAISAQEADEYTRSMFRRSRNEAVMLRSIRFTTDEQGKITAEMTGNPFIKQINQVNLFAVDYSEAHAKIAAMASRASYARRVRIQAEKEANTVREHNLAVCTELLPFIKESISRFVECNISKDYHNGNVTITIPAAQLENLVELLSHTESRV
jgi:hypothetical protein